MTLINPLIAGFHPDPSVVRVGDLYYIVTSTFEYLPGIPIHVSRDLVDWTQIGNVITRPEQGQLESIFTGGGVWAPTIRYRDGRFFVIVTIAAGRGCVVFSAEDPAGEWDDGTVIEGVEGIDPDLAWDEDGTAVVTYSALILKGEDIGRHGGIRQVDVDIRTGETIGKTRDLWSGTGLKFPEAPHVYRRGDVWYLMIAEGGTERGHGVSIARGPSVRGPFEPHPHNPILSARSTDRPVQNTGHGDLVDTADGRTLMVLLGTRPRGLTQSFAALGRETFITEVSCTDEGWPVAEPVQLNARGAASYTIDFADGLDAGWISMRRPPESVADLDSTPGRLTLHGEGRGLDHPAPVFVGRRQQHPTASVSTVVNARHGSGGLAVRYDERTVYSLRVHDDGDWATVVATAAVPGISQSWSTELPSGPVELRLAAEPPEGDDFDAMLTCDVVRFAVRTGDGSWNEVAAVDGRYLTAETAASFTGRVIGLYSISGVVVFEDYRYVGSEA